MMMGRKKVAGVLVLGGVVTLGAVVGVRAALALSPGVRGGRARTALSVAGTINGGTATGSTVMVEYVFLKGSAEACRVPTMLNRNTSNGHFTGEVDIERCPGDLFDGSDVTVRVEAGGAAVATGAVNPVPYARYAEQVGVGNDCPAGFTRDATATPGIVCARTVTLGSTPLRDEVVKVGVGASAFWVDRFEASAHLTATGMRLGESNTTGGSIGFGVESSGINGAGQRPPGEVPVRALSHPGQPTVGISWFQANEACRASGKRLLDRDEWFAAASGTQDGPACNVFTSGARAASPANGCVSESGVHDMIGNVWEWTNEWYTGTGTTSVINEGATNWGPGGSQDATYNVNCAVANSGGISIGVPAAALRGGAWNGSTSSGTFTLNLGYGPMYSSPQFGFRCVVPR